MRLHILPSSPRAIKVVAAKNHLGLDCEIRPLDYFSGYQTTSEFAALNPNRRMPVLEEDGWVLWESNAILIYFATKKPEIGLWPSDPREQTDILRWMFWDASHWDVACDIIVTERLKKQLLITQESGRRTLGKAVTPQPIDPEHLAEGERYVRELAAVLDEHLRGRIWLVGDRVTVAYFALGAFMHLREPVGPLPLSEFHEIVRWYEGVRQLPAWEVALQSIARPA